MSAKAPSRIIHGGASEKKEIDPANRGSIILGSVAYYFDRYGYEILPIALRMLQGEQVPAQTLNQARPDFRKECVSSNIRRMT